MTVTAKPASPSAGTPVELEVTAPDASTVGAPVTLICRVSASTVTCTVRPDRGGSQPLTVVTARDGSLTAQFTPTTDGRWWFEWDADGIRDGGCFWVKPARV